MNFAEKVERNIRVDRLAIQKLEHHWDEERGQYGGSWVPWYYKCLEAASSMSSSADAGAPRFREDVVLNGGMPLSAQRDLLDCVHEIVDECMRPFITLGITPRKTVPTPCIIFQFGQVHGGLSG